MKVALCLSGLARTFKKCYQSYLDYMINVYDCDAFIFVSKDQNSQDMDLIPSVRKVILEQNPVLDEKNYVKYKSRRYTVQGFLQQFWKIEECHKMLLEYKKEKNITYDFVIRSRPDICIIRPLELQKLDSKYLYISINSYRQKFFCNPRFFEKDFVFDYKTYWALPDRFAIASEELMGVYSRRYSELDAYYNKNPQLNSEWSLYGHLKNYNVPIKFLPQMHNLIR